MHISTQQKGSFDNDDEVFRGVSEIRKRPVPNNSGFTYGLDR